MRSLLVGAIVFGAMLIEARRAWRNEREQRARSGIEPPGDVYALMRIAYPAAFVAMLTEGALRGPIAWNTVLLGAIVFVAAKALKYWAIASLGPFWTFRVIVVPGSEMVTHGPYRFLRHPNYVGVVGELVGVALMSGAIFTGTIGTIGFALIIARRIAIEEGAILNSPSRRARADRVGAGSPSPDEQSTAAE